MKTTVKILAKFALVIFACGIGLASAVQFTCVATVYTGPQASGFAPLGSKVVNGATVTDAASACHSFARQSFKANNAWADPNRVCTRYPGGPPRNVEVLDYFKEMGHAGGFNRVGGFNVTCSSPIVVRPFPTVPTVVPSH